MGERRLVGSLLTPIRHLRRALEGVEALTEISREIRGLRHDVQEVIAGIDGLRDDVRSLRGGVGGIREATESLDGKIDAVTVHLENVSMLAGRLGRLGARRTRADAG